MNFVDAAEKLLSQLGINTYPVPVEEIAKKLGVKVTQRAFDRQDNLSGVLFKEDGNVTIAVNSHDPVQRRRFTLAHEIGHLVLKHKGDIFVDQSIRLHRDGSSQLAIDPFEIEANGFAAELLMPRTALLTEFNRWISKANIKTDQLIHELASAFDVSAKAMDYRLQNLGLILDH